MQADSENKLTSISMSEDSLFILRALQALLWVTHLAGPMLSRRVLVWFLFLHLHQFKPTHSSSGILTRQLVIF